MKTETETIETWEQSREREKKERCAKAKAAIKLLTEVAKNLGMERTDKAKKDDPFYRQSMQADFGNEQRKIFMRAHGYQNENRIYVSGLYPKYSDGSYCTPANYNETLPSITVSFNKEPKKIAQDIERRLFPAYDKMLEQAKEKIKNQDNHENKTKETWEKIGITPSLKMESAYLDSSRESTYGTVKVNGSHITLEIRTEGNTEIIKSLLQSLKLRVR